jgi:hypothetical protein
MLPRALPARSRRRLERNENAFAVDAEEALALELVARTERDVTGGSVERELPGRPVTKTRRDPKGVEPERVEA